MDKPTNALKTIEELAPDPRNPRAIDAAAAAGLGASIRAFGDISGITFNRQTGELVSGHQRVERLIELGATIRNTDDGRREILDPATGEAFPVRIVDWNRAKQRAANIAANNSLIAGTFTDELQPLLSELADSEYGGALGELRLEPLIEAAGDAELPTIDDEDMPERQQMAFVLTEDEAELVRKAIAVALKRVKTDGNKNGAALALVCAEYCKAW